MWIWWLVRTIPVREIIVLESGDERMSFEVEMHGFSGKSWSVVLSGLQKDLAHFH